MTRASSIPVREEVLMQARSFVKGVTEAPAPASRSHRFRLAALALVAVALVAPAQVSAQAPGNVSGTVVDSATAQGIPGVQISISGTTRGAVSDDAGRY